MSQGNSRFPFAPLEEGIDLTDPRMRTWLQELWQTVNSMRMPPAATQPTLGASPVVYRYEGAGLAELFLSGGTVSLVEFSRNGTVYLTAGTATDRAYLVNQGDYLRITYAVAPVLTVVAR